MSDNSRFEEILLDSIDEAFSSLGEKVKYALFFHLENKFKLTRIEIPNKILDFSGALEKIFGLAARNLEILIMKKLHQKITCSYKWQGPSWLVPDVTFREYIELLRVSFENENKIGEVEVWVDDSEKPKQFA
jgi:hypothetical protein